MRKSLAKPAIDEIRRALRLRWRGELDVLPHAEIVIPAEEVARKPGLFYVETELIDRANAWEFIRDAIDDALARMQRL